MGDRDGAGAGIFVARSAVALVEDGAEPVFLKDGQTEKHLAFFEEFQLSGGQAMEWFSDQLLNGESIIGQAEACGDGRHGQSGNGDPSGDAMKGSWLG